MPAGRSWPSYLGAATCALISMFAGAQTVHIFYKPLQGFNSKVEMEKKRLTETTNAAEHTSGN